MATSTVPHSKRKQRYGIPVLFCTTAFLGASLIFSVQPLVSKLLLPSYGGSAAVWTTSSFFFQVILLLGYILVHGSTRFSQRRQPLTFLPVVLAALLFLPLALPVFANPEGHAPMGWLVVTLLAMISMPFLLLSTTGPLLQKWYSWTDAPRAQDPYFLYAASNVGSFVGLLSYPFLVEPNLTLAAQRTVWTAGFVAFIALMIACCAVMLRSRSAGSTAVEAVGQAVDKLSWPVQAKWVMLAFLPSSLMLGVTTHIATDVASIPLLWVVPLSIYILTMIWAFGRTKRTTPEVVVYLAGMFAALSLAFTLAPHSLGAKSASALLFVTLAFVAFAAHSLLANGRPDPVHLTRYFVLVSLGGALGGMFNSMVAPLIFVRPFEFPLVLALVPFLLLAYKVHKPVIYGTVLFLLIAVPIRDVQGNPGVVERSRTFYGSYMVEQHGERNVFIHGTTLHGIQSTDPKLEQEPLSYYAKAGPLGSALGSRRFEEGTFVGLGIGVLATYGQAGTKQHFIEIDPEVERIASNEDYFTYLKNAKADVSVEIADGRLAIADLPDKSQDLILLDAFSSDSVPVHLLTEEAMRMYDSKLKEDGLLIIHISNRIFDLAPVVASGAKATGRVPFYMSKGAEEVAPLGVASSWMALPRDADTIEQLKQDGWKDLSYVKPVRWTDDYSSVLDVLY